MNAFIKCLYRALITTCRYWLSVALYSSIWIGPGIMMGFREQLLLGSKRFGKSNFMTEDLIHFLSFCGLRAMNISRPSVHPVEAPPLTNGVDHNVLRVRMKDMQGMSGTLGGFGLRLCQLVFGIIALCVMTTTSDFPSVTAFRFLVAAVSLQCLWSLAIGVLDGYAILVRRSFRNCGVKSLFTIGDGITSTLTFAAACSSAGITVLIGNDLNKCNLNHCARFESATAMAFISWLAVSPSFLLNFWSLASPPS